jgi:tRNA G10  N-methylase Trm11
MPALSAAELVAVAETQHLPTDAFVYAPGWVEADIPEQQIGALQRQLAGTVKIGQVIAEGADLEQVLSLALIYAHVEADPRMEFAFSGYPEEKAFGTTLRKLGMQRKKELIADGYKARYVVSKDAALSSAAVVKNDLLGSGTEFMVLKGPKGYTIAVTKTVQHFEAFASRDRARTHLDAKSGMLPPQLARLMVNLAGVREGSTILDPFCGSGTVLTEARDMNLHVIGSDNSAKAISDAEKNLEAQESSMRWRLMRSDVAFLRKNLPATVDAIVTEPFLGSPQRQALGERAQENFFNKLQQLYRNAFTTFAQLLPTGGRVVFVFPAIQGKGDTALYPFLDELLLENGFRIHQPLSKEAVATYRPVLSKRNSLLYARPGQRIAREILILESVPS